MGRCCILEVNNLRCILAVESYCTDTMSYKNGPFIEAGGPARSLGEDELKTEVEHILAEEGAEVLAKVLPSVPVGTDATNLDLLRQREIASLAEEAAARKYAMDEASKTEAGFDYEARLHSPSVYVHRPDTWNDPANEKFRKVVEFLYRNEGLRFPLDEGMNDISRKTFQKIIDEVCNRVDDEWAARTKNLYKGDAAEEKAA